MAGASRATVLRDTAIGPGPVVYWMSRDQRCADNWALVYAQLRALERSAPLHVALCFAPGSPGPSWRQ